MVSKVKGWMLVPGSSSGRPDPISGLRVAASIYSFKELDSDGRGREMCLI